MIKLKDNVRVQQLIDELKSLADNQFELHRINVLERDLTAPPVVEVVDDTHQKFDDVVYRKNRDGHYLATSHIHRVVYSYYFGDIPSNIAIHHIDEIKSNNDISNLISMPKSEHNRIHMKKTRANMKKKKFICIRCGKTFQAFDTGGNKYCSDDCKKKTQYENQLITKNCKLCGKEFKTRKYYNSDYCTSCSRKVYCQENKEISTCKFCGNEFPKVKGSNKIYCSEECKNKSRRAIYREKRTCIICGKEFETDKFHHSKCCSPSCAAKFGRQNKEKI